MSPKKTKGTAGRPKLPPEDQLVSNGIHMHPQSKRDLIEVTAFLGTSQREVIEDLIAQRKAKVVKIPGYDAWVAAGRPVPIQEWNEDGRPKRWAGKKLDLANAVKAPGSKKRAAAESA